MQIEEDLFAFYTAQRLNEMRLRETKIKIREPWVGPDCLVKVIRFKLTPDLF